VTAFHVPAARVVLVLSLAMVNVMSAPSSAQGQPAPGPPPPIREIEIAAGRFAFAPDTIDVVEGEHVRLLIRSLDVTHGFAIPDLGIDRAIPADGSTVTVEFVADRPGHFAFSCSHYCGVGHTRMAGMITVRPAGAQVTDAAPSGGGADVDFTLISLPTTLELPRHRAAFRVAHRFSRPLGRGDFGDLAGDFFGFDSSALIGLEFRVSPVRRGQVGIYRTSNRTIQLFGQYELLRQSRHGVTIDALLAIDGTNNFRDEYSPIVGAVVSRAIGDRLSLHAQPVWIGNVNHAGLLLHPARPGSRSTEAHSVLLGLGGRFRLRPTVFVVAEVAPRLSGFVNGDAHASFAIEKRVGGHGFQVNISNGIGSTLSQLAQGGSEDDWFIGFNITRRFY